MVNKPKSESVADNDPVAFRALSHPARWMLKCLVCKECVILQDLINANHNKQYSATELRSFMCPHHGQQPTIMVLTPTKFNIKDSIFLLRHSI